jgi:endo-1,3-1,4-beta-glycanase ExoK
MSWTTLRQDPLITSLGFNAETDYHLWTPSGIEYIADGVVLRTWTKNSALLKRPLTVLFAIWASRAASWAGALTATSAPTSADIDWIKVYDWKG